MTLPAWWLLPLAPLVLLVGQQLVNRIKLLRRLDLPPAIVGGILAALILMTLNLTGHPVAIASKVTSTAWLWLITPEWRLPVTKPIDIYLPLSTFFFASVGLCASVGMARRGSWQILLLLALATFLGFLQNRLGVMIAGAMHAPPLLGVVCGSLTLLGGPSTALGRVSEFEAAGLSNAAVAGTAAAMFGIVTASLLGGATGGQLIRRFHLHADRTPDIAARKDKPPVTLLGSLAPLRQPGANVAAHLIILLLCVKLGAYLTFGWQILADRMGWSLGFPVYMGAIFVSIAVRNTLDALGIRLLRTEVIEALGGIALRLFLAMAIAGLDLLKLQSIAGVMAVILGSQVVLTIVYCAASTYLFMGRDYDAAVMTAGHVGFGLGITPNAVASMENLTETFGPAPRAVLVATIVGAFLIDLTNAFLITFELHHVH